MKRALLIGLGGIGKSVYLPELQKLEYLIDTVDMNSALSPSFTTIDDVLADPANTYDVCIICVPNYLHQPIAEKAIQICNTVLVEKPGFADAQSWKDLVDRYPDKRLCLVKNNSYRDMLLRIEEDVSNIKIVWLNKDRVPNPGSWFTDKSKAFGGVAYDLMPHLLCYLELLIGSDILTLTPTYHHQEQRFTLQDLTSSDYGEVDPNGVFDVCDFAELRYTYKGINIQLIASWKEGEDNQSITFEYKNSLITKSINFGLCPSEMYGAMIQFNELERYDFHKNLDLYIHQTLELFK